VAQPLPARALRPAERKAVLACLHQERSQDRSPAAVYATLLRANRAPDSALSGAFGFEQMSRLNLIEVRTSRV